jgi:hypothetical protein
MPKSKSTTRAESLELPRSDPPSRWRQREVKWQEDGDDDGTGLIRRRQLEYGGDLDEIRARIQFVRVEARGPQAVITAGIVASALIAATFEDGLLPGLVAMAALTLLGLVQYFGPRGGGWQGPTHESPPRQRGRHSSKAMRSSTTGYNAPDVLERHRDE